MKHRSYLMTAAMLLVLAGLFAGCDVGVNPLLFDGEPVSAELVIHPGPTETAFAQVQTVNLMDILSEFSDDFDSVNVFNITLQVENTGNMPTTTLLSGGSQFNGSNLVSFTNKPLSDFLAEQSIFKLQGVTVQKSTVLALKNAVNDALRGVGSPTATIGVAGSSSNTNVNLKAIVRVYTQIFTKK